MNIISIAFNEVLYRPLYNALVLLYNVIPGHDLGIAIIALTILIRLALHPLSVKAIKAQKRLQEIQPELQELQQKYKDNREKQAMAVMELYRQKNISPTSGCLPLLIQLPLLIALYQVFSAGLNSEGAATLYSFVAKPELLSPITLGILDLSKSNLVLAVIAGFTQFIQTKTLMSVRKKHTPSTNVTDKKDQSSFSQEFSEAMNKQMLYVMPLVTIYIASIFSAGIALYWIVTSTFSIVEQYLISKK